jgi:beta-phosphoglucomutase
MIGGEPSGESDRPPASRPATSHDRNRGIRAGRRGRTLLDMKGIVFDFDGVIVDSEPLHEATLRQAARALGMDFTHEGYVTRYIGYDDRDVLAALAKDHGRTVTTDDDAKFHALKHEAFLSVVSSGGVRAFPGSVELIRSAAARGPVAVCSGARRHEIDPILHALGVAPLFSTIVSADDVRRSKPDPEGYLLTARRLGHSPSDLVAIEDTSFGVASALGAGCRAAAVCHSMPASELSSATRVFESTARITIDALASLFA